MDIGESDISLDLNVSPVRPARRFVLLALTMLTGGHLKKMNGQNGLDKLIESAWQTDTYPELKDYFDSEPFQNVRPKSDDNIDKMFSEGHIRNVSMKFRRLLESGVLLHQKGNPDSKLSALEAFINQNNALTDVLAAAVCYFCDITGVRPRALNNEDLNNTLKEKLGSLDIDYNSSKMDEYYTWIIEELYPYRNIVHHLGDTNTWTSDGNDVFIPDPEKYEMKEILEEMRRGNYPDMTSYLIANDLLVLPNILTGEKGDGERSMSPEDLSSRWIEKTHNLLIFYIDLVVKYQSVN